MKRQKFKRNRSKFVNLVELVRNRSRYHPYIYHSSRSYETPFFTRLTAESSRQQCIWNSRLNSETSTRKRRAHLAQSRRRSTSRPEITAVATEDRGVDASPTYSSVHTQYENYSQPSIPCELRRLLQEESSDSIEDVAKADTRKNIEDPTVPDLKIPQTTDSGMCSQCNNHVDLILPDVFEQDEEQEVELPEIEVREVEVQVQEFEEQEHISEPEEQEEHSVADNTSNHSRSRVLELSEQPADEEAGGDGHHNNSVIEIEITLTSSNDNNSDEEENVIVDEESEE